MLFFFDAFEGIVSKILNYREANKRVNALQFNNASTEIVVADKFGDVYAYADFIFCSTHWTFIDIVCIVIPLSQVMERRRTSWLLFWDTFL